MIKKKIKEFIPFRVRFWLRKIQNKIFGTEREYKNMSHTQIFDKIYSNKTWGETYNGQSTSGDGSHLAYIIQPYINMVNSFLSETKPSSIVDLGCGDFNIGKNFVPFTHQYIASDVSSVILERNKVEYSNFNNVNFVLIDITKNNLPKADVGFIRQVLQHLSNQSIKKFVTYVNQHKPFKHLLVTEQLSNSNTFRENIDKPTGSGTRVNLNSGVVLHQKPFLLNFKSYKVLLDVPVYIKKPEDPEGKVLNTTIRTTLYKF